MLKEAFYILLIVLGVVLIVLISQECFGEQEVKSVCKCVERPLMQIAWINE